MKNFLGKIHSLLGIKDANRLNSEVNISDKPLKLDNPDLVTFHRIMIGPPEPYRGGKNISNFDMEFSVIKKDGMNPVRSFSIMSEYADFYSEKNNAK